MRPSSFKEKELIQRITRASDQAFNKLKDLYPKLEEADEMYDCYVEPLTDPIAREEEQEEEKVYGIASRIKIPFTTALVQALVSYIMAIFTSRLPFIKIEGQGPEDVIPAKKQTLVIALQMQRIKAIMKLHQFLFDAIKYGIAWMRTGWLVKTNAKGIIYKGNDFENIYPQFVLHDPRVSAAHFQDGEYVIEVGNIHRSKLIQGARDGIYFDVIDEIPHQIPEEKLINDQMHPFLNKDTYFKEADRDMVFYEKAHIKIRPREYGLDDSDDYEIWNIMVANRSKIVLALREESSFGGFPLVCAQSYPDLYVVYNEGLPHLLKYLQQYVDFLFNSHLANVRRGVNMAYVYDPHAIEEEDLTAHKYVKLIRMKELSMGRAASDVIYQLPVNDVTQNNVRDAVQLMELMQKISAVADIIMGMPYVARRSATEIAGAQRFAANRIKTMAEVINEQALMDLVEMFVLNNIDNLTGRMWARILGGWEQEYAPLQAKIENQTIPFVQMQLPDDLVGNFDYALTEAVLPTEKVSQTQAWQTILQIIGQSELLMQQIDATAVFKEFAQTLGIKNISSFLRPVPIVTPPGETAQGGGERIRRPLSPEETASRTTESMAGVV